MVSERRNSRMAIWVVCMLGLGALTMLVVWSCVNSPCPSTKEASESSSPSSELTRMWRWANKAGGTEAAAGIVRSLSSVKNGAECAAKLYVLASCGLMGSRDVMARFADWEIDDALWASEELGLAIADIDSWGTKRLQSLADARRLMSSADFDDRVLGADFLVVHGKGAEEDRAMIRAVALSLLGGEFTYKDPGSNIIWAYPIPKLKGSILAIRYFDWLGDSSRFQEAATELSGCLGSKAK